MRERVRVAGHAAPLVSALCLTLAGCGPDATVTQAPLPSRPPVLDEITDQIRVKRELAQAAERARRLLPEFEARYGRGSIEVGWLLDVLVEALRRDVHGHEEETLGLAERAVAIKKKHSDHFEVTVSQLNLAEVHVKRNEDAKAERLFEEAVTRREEILPRGHREIWKARIYIAAFHSRRQRFAEALTAYEKALADLPPRESSDANQISDRMLTLQSLGQVYRHTEAFADALRLLREVVDTRRILGSGRPHGGRGSEQQPGDDIQSHGTL